ncbi:hypothetical protein [Actinoplanes sp. NPDC051494]|uniref:hypothetical protein n=1 Tax=Actinoplanes sp. NPDC051494 TaxID=3363907 RepID=UPI0037B95C24
MPVTLLDLRDPGGTGPDRLAGKVLVLDDAEALVRHTETYLSLFGDPLVTGVICVAIGEAGGAAAADGVVLPLPTVLRGTTVLWVGDVIGLEWSVRRAAPRFPGHTRTALPDLIAALLAEDVFDEVESATRGMAHTVASPGVRLALGPTTARDLDEAGATAIRSLCLARTDPSRELAGRIRDLDAAPDAPRAALTGPIAAAGAEAVRRLDRLDGALDAAATWRALAGPEPTRVLSTDPEPAGQAAENYRRCADELLNRMDGHIQNGRPAVEDVAALGAGTPAPARDRELATGLRALVGARIEAGVTLPVLARELRTATAYCGPQGVGTAIARIRGLGPQSITPPDFPRWPLRLVLLPVIALSCLVLALSPNPVLAAGPAAGWFLGGWLLLARRPGPAGSRGFGATATRAAATYGLAAVTGVLAGVLLRRYVADAPRVPYPIPVLVLLLAGVVAATLLGWRAAVRRWRADLPLDQVRAAVTTIGEVVAGVWVTEWQPLRRHQRIAELTAAAAGAIEVMNTTLEDAADGLFPASRQHAGPGPGEAAANPLLPELSDVVRGDLAGLCRDALEPLWLGGLAARDGDEYALRLRHRIAEYGLHVARYGLISPFDPGTGPGPRDALLRRVWNTSPQARATLRLGAYDELTQLCDGRQLSYLSSVAEPHLLRFAPRRLGPILREDPADRTVADDPAMLWTDTSESVGALRLLPLRPESVRIGWGGEAG